MIFRAVGIDVFVSDKKDGDHQRIMIVYAVAQPYLFRPGWHYFSVQLQGAR